MGYSHILLLVLPQRHVSFLSHILDSLVPITSRLLFLPSFLVYILGFPGPAQLLHFCSASKVQYVLLPKSSKTIVARVLSVFSCV